MFDSTWPHTREMNIGTITRQGIFFKTVSEFWVPDMCEVIYFDFQETK